MTTLTQLAEIPELAALLFTAWGHPFRAQEEVTHKPVAGPRVPIDLDAYDALRTDEHGLLFALMQAVRAILEEAREAGDYDLEAAEVPTWVSETKFIAETREWWVSDDWLADYVPDQVRTVHHALKTALHERDTYRPKCRCGGLLVERDGGSWYGCDACGQQETIDARLRDLGKIKHATLAELAVIVQRPHITLKWWSHKGRIKPAKVERGRKLYDIAAVTAYAKGCRPQATDGDLTA